MNHIMITVEPRYLPELSNESNDEYLFQYTINIENQSGEVLVLRRRKWKITDAYGYVETVSGEGVVGEQPEILPGDSYTYSSSAKLVTPWGSMSGYYEFESDSGERFEVPIPQFDLRSNITIH